MEASFPVALGSIVAVVGDIDYCDSKFLHYGACLALM